LFCAVFSSADEQSFGRIAEAQSGTGFRRRTVARLTGSFGVHEDHWRTEKVAAISLTSSHVLRNGFPTGGMPCARGLCPRLLICEIEPIFRFDLNPCRRRERTLTGWITL
jgi:hypothetical protein